MSWGQAAGALASGVLGGLFGGHAKVNPYAGQLTDAANDLGDIRSSYQGMTNSAQNGYQQYDPQYRQSVNSYANYLQTDPYTDQYSTQVLGQATAGTNAAYNAAKTNLAADMGRRGITGSSVDNGSLASIDAARAGDISAAQNNLAQQKVASQQSRLNALVGLLGGVSNGYQNAAMQGLAGQSGATEGIASIYSGLNSAANAAAEQSNANWNTDLSNIGAGLGGLAPGMSGLFRSKSASPPFYPTPDGQPPSGDTSNEDYGDAWMRQLYPTWWSTTPSSPPQ